MSKETAVKIKRFALKKSVIPDIQSWRSPYGTYVNKDAAYIKYFPLCNDIDLNIAFPEDFSKWNDFDYVLVLDEDFGQPYYPFYDYLNGRCELFPVLEKVIQKYNKVMECLPFLEEVK